MWSSTGIARRALLYARVGRHPGKTLEHSSIPAKAGVDECCRGKLIHWIAAPQSISSLSFFGNESFFYGVRYQGRGTMEV
jgi:hypothetical protein